MIVFMLIIIFIILSLILFILLDFVHWYKTMYLSKLGVDKELWSDIYE